jgi:two-component system, chemotaxis family, protein-glutamate methylesterase/glutaminase
VIDDSVLARRVITRAFEREPTIEVVGAMRNGRAAVMRAETLRPDVVLLDSEVAGADGCATLAELKRRHPELRAVLRGDGAQLSEDQVRLELLPAIRGVPVTISEPFTGRAEHAPAQPVEAIVVAASTGGPDALEALLSKLPANLAAPLMIVQHMPAEFTRMLAERLDRHTALSVVEASADEVVAPGRAYIAPGGSHMGVKRGEEGVAVEIRDGPPENSCRPAADVLFRTAATAYGDRLLAVVLTGMGRDGLRGADAVRRAGGWVLAQSEQSAVIASMPASVAAAGLANLVVDLGQMGDVLTRFAGRR